MKQGTTYRAFVRLQGRWHRAQHRVLSTAAWMGVVVSCRTLVWQEDGGAEDLLGIWLWHWRLLQVTWCSQLQGGFYVWVVMINLYEFWVIWSETMDWRGLVIWGCLWIEEADWYGLRILFGLRLWSMDVLFVRWEYRPWNVLILKNGEWWFTLGG